MRYRPGKMLLWAALGLALLSPIVFLSTSFIFVLGIAAILLAVAAIKDKRSADLRLVCLAVKRDLPLVVGRDQPFTAQLLVTSTASHSLQVQLRDVVPDACVPQWSAKMVTVSPSTTEEVLFEYRVPVRGRHVFPEVWVRVSGSWNLLEAQERREESGVIKVLPETFASREKLTKDSGAEALLLDQMTKSRQNGAGTEFESLDVFREGDDPRRIDWRATARSPQPIVRRFQIERHRDVMILIDTGRLMGGETDAGSKLDCAVDAGLNLARVALQSGDRCGIAAYDSDVRGFLPPVAGMQSLGMIVESAFDLQTNWKESDFTRIHAEMQARHSKRSLLIVISDLGDAETSRMQCAALRKLSQRHVVLFAALKTPSLQHVINRPLENIDDGARKAVTFRLLADRGRALHVLQRAGVHVVDIEPEELTVPLINQFVELRTSNLL